jgi:ABC-type transport system involved in cytochrome bd biosynthesis fused ATPase/permease subunit
VLVRVLQAQLAVGRGAENRLRDKYALALLDEVTSTLRSGNISGAALDAVQMLGLRLAVDPGFHLSSGVWDLIIWVVILCMIFTFFHPCRLVVHGFHVFPCMQVGWHL